MKIDITNSNSVEIIQLMYKFPRGKIEVEKDKAYWICDEPVDAYNQTVPQASLGKRGDSLQGGVQRMREHLFDAFS